MHWEESNEIKKHIEKLVKRLGFSHIKADKIFCYATTGSRARAYARTWMFPKIFQKALGIEPAYVIEVISERFGKLSTENKIKVLIHELLHIPKNFSGSLLPHRRGRHSIERQVDRLYKMIKDH